MVGQIREKEKMKLGAGNTAANLWVQSIFEVEIEIAAEKYKYAEVA